MGRLPSQRVEPQNPKKPGSDRVRGALRASIAAAEPAAAAAALAVSRETDSVATSWPRRPDERAVRVVKFGAGVTQRVQDQRACSPLR